MKRHIWTVEKLERRWKLHMRKYGRVDYGWFAREFAEAEKREKKKAKD